MRNAWLASLLLTTLLPGTVCGDDVYLTNGEVFEGVIAEVGESRVRIRLPSGAMNLSRSQVLRVEEADTPLERFERRRQALRDTAATSPDQWLELARWTKVNGLKREHREVTLLVAEISPFLEGLAPLMRNLGYSLDENQERWISVDEYKRQQGLVPFEGQWVTQEEYAEQVRARREERAAQVALETVRARARVEERKARDDESAASATAKALETLAKAQTELLSGVLAAVGPGGYVLPGFLGSGSFAHRGFRPGGRVPLHHPGLGRSGDSQWDQLVNRQPGSLIPVHHPHHRPRR